MEYSALVSTHLKRIRDTWLSPMSQASMSVLLQLTNSVLTKAASLTNEPKPLKKRVNRKQKKIPPTILKAQRKLNKSHKKATLVPSASATNQLRQCRKSYHQTVRKFNLQSDLIRDRQLYEVMGQNPNKVFSLVKSLTNAHGGAVAKLKVGEKIYHGEKVADGFFESMSSLKKCDIESLKSSPYLADKLLDIN